jgi:hypothetical protein
MVGSLTEIALMLPQKVPKEDHEILATWSFAGVAAVARGDALLR